MKNSTLVSIIIPAYNCESYIEETLDSILQQTYTDWEAIIINDSSTDNTLKIINEYINKDHRFKVIDLVTNQGAAKARNAGIKLSTGRFLAFLDSDDTWEVKKLESQIKFMLDNEYSFSSTSYKKIDENGTDLNKVIKVKFQKDYKDLLKNCPGNSTVMIDLNKVEKVYGYDLKKRNDYVLWLKVIKKVKNLYGLDEVLASHRIRDNSISSNKFSLLKYHWYIYLNIEKLSFFKSLLLMIYWILKSTKVIRVKMN
ncbi:glycosyltransferase family 2 protein [Exiguobacterium sp. TDN 0502]|uniref:glycosyltransferase family 2 protein n=1 Tax=Exiguobacterium sp. TDN 0502 TaxID=3420731 RepID=UPI003D76DC96